MAVSKATYASTISSKTPGTAASKSQPVTVGAKYYAGHGGDKMWGEGAECNEAMAYAAGHAVATNTPAQLCEHIQGMKIIIGDTFESLQGAIEQVNMNFATNGTQPVLANNLVLNAPVVA